MSLRTQYISSHLFFLILPQQRASVAPSLLLCQYSDSATLPLLPLLVPPQPLGSSFSTPLLVLCHGSHRLESGFLDSSLGICPFLPNLSTQYSQQVSNSNCVKEALFDWPVIIQDTVTTLGRVPASASLIGYWTSRVPQPLGQASVLGSICYNQGSRALTYIMSTHAQSTVCSSLHGKRVWLSLAITTDFSPEQCPSVLFAILSLTMSAVQLCCK